MSGIFKGASFRDKPARNMADRKLLSEAPNSTEGEKRK
jgi:hypothetical protein